MSASRPNFERLEARLVPTTFGNLWANPESLTLSFVSDSTEVGLKESDLFSAMQEVGTTEQWQEEILRAYQTWAVETNINLGVVDDNGAAMGSLGLVQNDPRFGDIRIGGFAQGPDTLAIAAPLDSVAGTWSGDVLLNTNVSFGLKNNDDDSVEKSWGYSSYYGHSDDDDTDDPSVESTNAGQNVFDLWTVMLHEAGHSLGLEGSQDPDSALAPYSEAKSELSDEDVEAIQNLYGARQHDVYEGKHGNNSFWSKTDLGTVSDNESISIYADLTTSWDVDYFAFRVEGATPDGITVEVDTNGYSLLAAKVTVIDPSRWWYSTIGKDSSSGPLDDDLAVQLDSLKDGGYYVVKVEGARDDVFGIGGYKLSIHTGPESETADQSQEPGMTELESLLDQGTNDSLNRATDLLVSIGYETGSRYEGVGSLTNSHDLDYYRFVTPSAQENPEGLVSVFVKGIDMDSQLLNVTVFDLSGNVVEGRLINQLDGTIGYQLSGALPEQEYFVQVSTAGSDGAHNLGNYTIVVQTGNQNLGTVLTATLDQNNPTFTFEAEVPESQLVHYELSAESVDPTMEAWILITAYDEWGNLIFSGEMKVGELGHHEVALPTGRYKLQLEAWTADGKLTSPILVRLAGVAISDPIGPETVDPTTDPSRTTKYDESTINVTQDTTPTPEYVASTTEEELVTVSYEDPYTSWWDNWSWTSWY